MRLLRILTPKCMVIRTPSGVASACGLDNPRRATASRRERTPDTGKRRKEHARHMDIVKGNMGWIEVIVGPMFSGKSEELIRRLRRAEIGKQRVQIFKPVIDQRYAKNGIVSHSGLEIPSELVQTGNDILEKVAARTEVIGVDEAQFLGESIVSVSARLAELGK